MTEIKNEKMYVLVAPDGTPQLSTMAPDFAMSIGWMMTLGDAGIMQPVAKLLASGYKLLPVRVTIIQDGDENEAFKKPDIL